MNIVIVIIIIAIIFMLFFTSHKRSPLLSGGVLFNNTGCSCGICSLVNLYEALIEPNFSHSTNVSDYNPTQLTTERQLDVNEIITAFQDQYEKDYTGHGFTTNIIPTHILLHESRPNPRGYFRSLIESNICGMILGKEGHYISIVILNYSIVILINDGHCDVYNINDFMTTINIGSSNPEYQYVIIRVNKIITADTLLVCTYNEVLYNLMHALKTYSDPEDECLFFEHLIAKFLGNYKILADTSMQIKKLYEIISYTHQLHEVLSLFNDNIEHALNANSFVIDSVSNLNNNFNQLLIFAYSPHHIDL